MASAFSMTRITAVWDRVNSSFWFVPAVMAVAAVGVSHLLIGVDSLRPGGGTERASAIYSFGPEGARAILSVIAGSMMTVASLIFSITMLSLQLASSQYGPRVLGNFMRDRTNQIVLGTFIATFLYCLFVLRSVRGLEGDSFVPQYSVAVAFLLAAVSVAVLIYFIHHIATSIRVEALLEQLAQEACAAVDRLFPEKPEPAGGGRLPVDFGSGAAQITGEASGYVQSIGGEALLAMACARDLVLRIDAPPGRFVADGASVIMAYPRERVTEEIARSLRGAVVIGRERTCHQDLDFAIRRIVELAQRSLSPGINDPTTALYCIDRLGEVLGRMAGRAPPVTRRLGDGGVLRVVTEARGLEEMACEAFAAIARYGIGDADVVIQLARAMAALEAVLPQEARGAVAALRAQILSAGEAAALLDFDRGVIAGGSRRRG